MTDGDQFVCCEESMVVIAYCCTRGAAKGKCKLGIFPEMISQVRQECCCDCRCQIPPGSPGRILQVVSILLVSHAAEMCFMVKAGVQRVRREETAAPRSELQDGKAHIKQLK